MDDDQARKAGRIIATAVLVAVVAGVLYFSWTYAGPVATIVYVIAFLVGASILPGTVFTLRDMTPDFLGRFYFAFGQLAWGGSWLVQTGDGWELCPGREADGVEQYYFDGEWHTLADTSHKTRLAWGDFGVVWHKQRGDLAQYRADDHVADDYQELTESDSDDGLRDVITADISDVLPADAFTEAESDDAESSAAVSDGGHRRVETTLDPDLAAKPGLWIVHLRDYWTDRIEAIGGVDLLEDVERVIQREEAVDTGASGKRIWIGSLLGLLLGAMTGYAAFALG